MPQMVPPKWVPRIICGKLCCYGWSPRTKYGCHRWSPQTICGAVSGPPLPQMVPLKLSLEIMSRGSYEVNLANMDRVIIIIIYFSLCIAPCSSYRRPSSIDTHQHSLEVIQLIESIATLQKLKYDFHT